MRPADGPWSITEHPGYIVIHDVDGREVCVVEGDTAQCMANARLIVAAPQLLSALETLDIAIAGSQADWGEIVTR